MSASVVSVAYGDSVSSVYYEKCGASHCMLGTEHSARVGTAGLEASWQLFVFPDRWVAIYTEEKPVDSSKSEVIVTKELAGATDGSNLIGLGTLRLLASKANGKPEAELVLADGVASSGKGQAFRLRWISSTWAPPSVTGKK